MTFLRVSAIALAACVAAAATPAQAQQANMTCCFAAN